jgi:hypothetical protein
MRGAGGRNVLFPGDCGAFPLLALDDALTRFHPDPRLCAVLGYGEAVCWWGEGDHADSTLERAEGDRFTKDVDRNDLLFANARH